MNQHLSAMSKIKATESSVEAIRRKSKTKKTATRNTRTNTKTKEAEQKHLYEKSSGTLTRVP